MPARSHRTFLLILAMSIGLLLAGCSDDDPVAAPTPGTIEVTVTPDMLMADWFLAGPGGFGRNGQGNATLDDLDPGDYTVVWSDVGGWVAPEPTWGELVSGETLRIDGEYIQQGSVVVDVLPNYIEPTWTLTGPDGYETTGHGDFIVVNLDPGEYTVAWGDLAGWDTPEAASGTLDAGSTVSLAGMYLVTPAATADEAIQLFRDTYSGRQLERYRLLLDDEFLFIAQDGGVDDYEVEVAIANKIFNGLEGDNGIAISNITIQYFEPLSVWEPTAVNDPNFGAYPDSQHRAYNVYLRFWVSGQNLILQAQGPVIFYVRNVAGGGNSEFEILGIVDQTYGNKATEDHSWTNLRALFD